MARTYWHLEKLKRKPSDYEITTSRLLYYVQRGFEIEVPVAQWYRDHQAGSKLQCSDWERFADPRETTYARYTALQSNREIYVDGLLQAAEQAGEDQRLSAEWVGRLGQILAPLRYPAHGLQMASAYVGQMAPAGRITICALLQTGDDIRRVQRLASRFKQLQKLHPKLADHGRMLWETDPAWQPLRQAIENLLVAWDWGEAFTALNFAVKPAFDELFNVALGPLAHANGDAALQKMLLSLNEDCRWHREWSAALVRVALSDRPANREALEGWLAKWRPLALAAVRGCERLFEPLGAAGRAAPFGEIVAGIEALLDEHWHGACDGGGPRPNRSRQAA